MTGFNNIVLSAIRGGEFTAELIYNSGYVEYSPSGRSDVGVRLAGDIVVWVDAERSPDFAQALKKNPKLPLTLVSNYGDLLCRTLSITGWPPIRIELQPDRRLNSAS